jgi:hypothetical protein
MVWPPSPIAYAPLLIVLLCGSDRKAWKPRVELGDLSAVFEKERAVCPFPIPVSLCLLLTVWPSFTPPSAHEAEAERLHFDPAHHGTDGERCGIHSSMLDSS